MYNLVVELEGFGLSKKSLWKNWREIFHGEYGLTEILADFSDVLRER